MSYPVLLLVCLAPLVGGCNSSSHPELRTGQWRAVITSPGGELPFGLLVREAEGETEVVIQNAREEIPVQRVEWDGGELVLGFDHYDSEIRARADEGGAFVGTWRKRTGTDDWDSMPFRMTFGMAYRFEPADPIAPVKVANESPPKVSVAGKWKASFETSSDAGIAWLEHLADDRLYGTIEMTTGDYRYLEGSYESGRLRLSCFDGAHAFLFDLTMGQGGALQGTFYSRGVWSERLSFLRDSSYDMPDAFNQTIWTGDRSLADLVFPGLDGELASPDGPEFAGHVRLVQIFGTWCPNCHDEAVYLAELEERYGARGLKIIGLAFELTEDFERNVVQVRRYRERYGLAYPILIAGTSSSKSKATETLGVLDLVRSYPTTLFVDHHGEVVGVHTGFAGPATPGYTQLRAEFEGRIEGLLNAVPHEE